MAGKRGNGEGSIHQLPSGKWRAQATLDGRRVGVVAKTHKEAQEQLRKLLSDADKGLMPPAERLTLAAHIERWLDDVVKPSVRARTTKGYRDIARLHIVPTLGRMKLAQIQPNHVQQLYSQLTAASLSAKSVRNVHAVLRHALNQAVDWNLTPRNVAGLAHPPRVERQEVIALTAEEVRALLTSVRGDRWGALIATALATGMRQGELLGLKWADVNLRTSPGRSSTSCASCSATAPTANPRPPRGGARSISPPHLSRCCAITGGSRPRNGCLSGRIGSRPISSSLRIGASRSVIATCYAPSS